MLCCCTEVCITNGRLQINNEVNLFFHSFFHGIPKCWSLYFSHYHFSGWLNDLQRVESEEEIGRVLLPTIFLLFFFLLALERRPMILGTGWKAMFSLTDNRQTNTGVASFPEILQHFWGGFTRPYIKGQQQVTLRPSGLWLTSLGLCIVLHDYIHKPRELCFLDYYPPFPLNDDGEQLVEAVLELPWIDSPLL